MKAPSQDFTVLSRGLFYFPALSRLRGAVALFVAWVCVYPPTMQRACCNSPTAAREVLARGRCAFLSKIPCVPCWNKLNDRSLRHGVAGLAVKGVALLRADVGRSAPARVDIDIEPTVALVDGAIPAVAASVFQPQHWRGAELLVAHVALRFHRGTGSGQLLGRPRFTHRYCLPSSSSTVK